jgi:hypothetical protein
MILHNRTGGTSHDPEVQPLGPQVIAEQVTSAHLHRSQRFLRFEVCMALFDEPTHLLWGKSSQCNAENDQKGLCSQTIPAPVPEPILCDLQPPFPCLQEGVNANTYTEKRCLSKVLKTRHQWLTSVILATWEVRSGELQFEDSPGKQFSKSYLQNN